MKKIKNICLYLVLISLGIFLFTGCKTTSNNQTPTEEAIIGYIKPLVTVACTAILETGINPEDKVNIAKQIYDVSKVVEGLTIGMTPTPDDLRVLLENYFPKEAKYASFVSAIKDAYANAFSKIDGNSKLAIRYLHEIAAGCRESAQNYLPK